MRRNVTLDCPACGGVSRRGYVSLWFNVYLATDELGGRDSAQYDGYSACCALTSAQFHALLDEGEQMAIEAEREATNDRLAVTAYDVR